MVKAVICTMFRSGTYKGIFAGLKLPQELRALNKGGNARQLFGL